MASDAMQPSASMTAATAAGTAADGPPAKKKRGSSGLPRGVSQTGSSKFQGRINYMPPGSRRGQQRGIGTFDTAEEAGLAVAEAEAKLKEQGPEAVWPEPARTNKHKRGEVRPMPNHHQHSSLTLSTTRICRRHLRSARRRGAGARTPQRSQPSPTYPQRVLRLGRHSTGRLQVRRPTRPSAPCHQPLKRSATSTWQPSWLLMARARSLRRPFLLRNRSARGMVCVVCALLVCPSV